MLLDGQGSIHRQIAIGGTCCSLPTFDRARLRLALVHSNVTICSRWVNLAACLARQVTATMPLPCHRDAVGAINILQEAIHGRYVAIAGCRKMARNSGLRRQNPRWHSAPNAFCDSLIGADIVIGVTYLRAVKRWSPNQRNTHHKVQRRKAITPSSARNQASAETSCKPKLANSSTSSLERDPLAAVA